MLNSIAYRVDAEALGFRDSWRERSDGYMELERAVKPGTGPCEQFTEWVIGDKFFAPPDTQKYGGRKNMYLSIANHIVACWKDGQSAPELECWMCDGVEERQRMVEVFVMSESATSEQAKVMGANGCPMCLLSRLYDVSESQLSQYKTKVGGQSVQQRHGGRQ